MSAATTHTLEGPGSVLTYEVCQPEAPSKHLPLFVFGSPMAGSGFAQLVGHLDDRTLITYDPRGAERSRLAADVMCRRNLSVLTAAADLPEWV